MIIIPRRMLTIWREGRTSLLPLGGRGFALTDAMKKLLNTFAAFPELQQWLAEQSASPEAKNPCVRLFGRGPENTTCKTCAHLYRNRKQKAYLKCDLRVHTNGPGSDHKAGWPACAKYQAKVTP